MTIHYLSTDGIENGHANSMGRSRVLTSNDLSIDNQLLNPVISLDILSTNALNLILKKNRHSAGQTNSLLLRVAETSSLTALKKRLSVNLDLGKDNRSVTHGSNRLASLVKLFDELDGCLVIHQIEHGAVTTGVENGVVLGRLAEEFLERRGLLPDLLLLVEELYGFFVGLEHLDGTLVEGCFTACGRSGGDLDAGVDEIVVRVSQLRLLFC
jgi:hypothetical protein